MSHLVSRISCLTRQAPYTHRDFNLQEGRFCVWCLWPGESDESSNRCNMDPFYLWWKVRCPFCGLGLQVICYTRPGPLYPWRPKLDWHMECISTYSCIVWFVCLSVLHSLAALQRLPHPTFQRSHSRCRIRSCAQHNHSIAAHVNHPDARHPREARQGLCTAWEHYEINPPNPTPPKPR